MDMVHNSQFMHAGRYWGVRASIFLVFLLQEDDTKDESRHLHLLYLVFVWVTQQQGDSKIAAWRVFIIDT